VACFQEVIVILYKIIKFDLTNNNWPFSPRNKLFTGWSRSRNFLLKSTALDPYSNVYCIWPPIFNIYRIAPLPHCPPLTILHELLTVKCSRKKCHNSLGEVLFFTMTLSWTLSCRICSKFDLFYTSTGKGHSSLGIHYSAHTSKSTVSVFFVNVGVKWRVFIYFLYKMWPKFWLLLAPFGLKCDIYYPSIEQYRAV